MKKVFKKAYSEYREASRELREAISKRDESGMRYWYPRHKEAAKRLLSMGFTF